MKTIRILRIIARLNIGGPALQAITLSAELGDGFQTLLVAGVPDKGEGSFDDQARAQVKDVVFIQELSRPLHPLRDAIAFFKICLLIRRFKPDIIHTHTAKAGTLGRLAGILMRVPVMIHTFHGNVFHGYFSRTHTRMFLGIERFLARRTDAIVAISDTQKNDLTNRYKVAGADRVRVVPLGFALEAFLNAGAAAGELRGELGAARDTVIVGIVGRLVEIKNIAMFLEAAALIKKQEPKVPLLFVVVGDGHLRKALEEKARALGIKDCVVFLGWRNDIPAITASFDIAVLCSLNEGTPVSLIEAMAAGKAVVATDVGGVRDVVQDKLTGELVPSGDVNAFAETIRKLINNESLRAQYGRSAQRAAAQRFTKERLIRDITALYKGFFPA